MEYSLGKCKIFLNRKEVTGYAPNEEIKPEQEYEFNYDLERMKQAVESETVYLPKGLKEKGEILEWMLNYDNKEK